MFPKRLFWGAFGPGLVSLDGRHISHWKTDTGLRASDAGLGGVEAERAETFRAKFVGNDPEGIPNAMESHGTSRAASPCW